MKLNSFIGFIKNENIKINISKNPPMSDKN